MNNDIINYKSLKSKDFFNNRQKINLIKYIFEFMTKEDILIISGVNSFLFFFIKEIKSTDIFAFLNVTYLRRLNKWNLTIDCLKEVTKEIVEKEVLDIEIVFDYISMFISKYIIKKHMKIVDQSQKYLSFMINTLDVIEFNFTDNYPLLLSLEDNSISKLNVQNFADTNFAILLKSLEVAKNFMVVLKNINFSNNELDDECLHFLIPLMSEKCSNLEGLNLSKNQLGKKEVSTKFLNTLKNNKNIKYVDISENKFNFSSIEMIISIYQSSNNCILNFNCTNNEFDLSSIIKVFENNYDNTSVKLMQLSFRHSPVYILYKGKQKILLNEFCRIYNDKYFNEYFESLKILDIEISNAFSSEQNFEILMEKLFQQNYENILELTLDFDSMTECIKNYLETYLGEKLKNLKIPINLYLKNDKNINEFCLPVKKNKFVFIQNINIKNILRKLIEVKFNRLTLSNISIDSDFIKVLQNILFRSSVNDLMISNCKPINNYECTFLFAGLKFTKIPKIIFKNCEVNDNGIKYLKKAISKNQNVKYLLFDN